MRRACFVGAALLIACGEDESATLPTAPVEVIVDQGGVPHVFAQDDRDAFFAAGYLQARDRLYQMDMARRRGLGRWSEVLGVSALEDDKLARLFNWRDLGRAVAEQTRLQNPEEWAVLSAWVAGVNRRVDEVLSGQAPLPYGFGPGELDYQPERWDDADPLVVAKLTGFGNDLSIEFEIFATLAERLHPEGYAAIDIHRPGREVFTVPPEDVPASEATSQELPAWSWDSGTREARAPNGAAWAALRRLARMRTKGSNNWAIDGRHTNSGMPLLANDPHQGFDFPGVFYALHINSADAGGSFDVAGFTFPGTPGVALGRTRSLGWTATTAFGDVMDVFDAPELDDATIELGGEPLALRAREEAIVVRDGATETFTFRDAPGIGVVLPDDIAPIPVASAGRVLFQRWTGYAVDRPVELLDVDRAASRDAFDATIDRQTSFNFHFLAADADGITYRVGLDVPERDLGDGRRPWQVQDGTDPAAQWSSAMLARELLPRGRAAERGWIVTANNDPFGFTANGQLADDPWYFGAVFDPGWRAGRIASELERLIGEGPLERAHMTALQLDTHDNLADDLLPLLDSAWSKLDRDEALAPYRDRPELATLAQLLLDDWDRRMDRSSPGALAFHAYEHLLAGVALEDDFALVYQPALSLATVFMLKVAMLTVTGGYPNGDALLQEGRDVVMLEALSQTAALLEQRFGSVDPAGYQLGDMKKTSWQSALGTGLDFGSDATDGGEATVNVSPSDFLDGSEVAEQWLSHFGAIFRMVIDFSADGTPELWYCAPLGNVADPASPHFRDQLEGWLEGDYRKMPFARSEVEAEASERVTLE